VPRRHRAQPARNRQARHQDEATGSTPAKAPPSHLKDTRRDALTQVHLRKPLVETRGIQKQPVDPDLRRISALSNYATPSTSPHPKKSAPSAWPGKPPPHNCESRVYIDPPEKRGADAEISWWVVDGQAGTGLERALDALVPRWIAADWPFTRPCYIGRDLSWADWLALPDTEP
jgi:hypothetical protein